MSSQSRVIAVGAVVRLGTAKAPLQFVEGHHDRQAWRGPRYLTLDSRPAFELSLWCGTCPFLFERLEGAHRTLSADALTDRLNAGLERIDSEVIGVAAELLPEGQYLPLLVQIHPQLIVPMREGDYFAEDQVRTWGLNAFWGLPEYPRTPYYRTGSRQIDPGSRLYEFAVPMMPPSTNEPDRVAAHAAALQTSSAPTCLAVSVLDVCQPAVDLAPESSIAHWGWTNFLLDGHHKIHAAAQANRPLRILTLLALDHSLATPEQLLALPSLLGPSSG